MQEVVDLVQRAHQLERVAVASRHRQQPHMGSVDGGVREERAALASCSGACGVRDRDVEALELGPRDLPVGAYRLDEGASRVEPASGQTQLPLAGARVGDDTERRVREFRRARPERILDQVALLLPHEHVHERRRDRDRRRHGERRGEREPRPEAHCSRSA